MDRAESKTANSFPANESARRIVIQKAGFKTTFAQDEYFGSTVISVN